MSLKESPWLQTWGFCAAKSRGSWTCVFKGFRVPRREEVAERPLGPGGDCWALHNFPCEFLWSYIFETVPRPLLFWPFSCKITWEPSSWSDWESTYLPPRMMSVCLKITLVSRGRTRGIIGVQLRKAAQADQLVAPWFPLPLSHSLPLSSDCGSLSFFICAMARKALPLTLVTWRQPRTPLVEGLSIEGLACGHICAELS